MTLTPAARAAGSIDATTAANHGTAAEPTTGMGMGPIIALERGALFCVPGSLMTRVSLAVYFEEVARRCSGVAFVHKRGYRRGRWTYRRVCETAPCFAPEFPCPRI